MRDDGRWSLRELGRSRLFVALVFAFAAADLLVRLAEAVSRALSDFINYYGHGFGLIPGHLAVVSHGGYLDLAHGLVLPLIALLIFALMAATLLARLGGSWASRPGPDDADSR